MRQRDRSRVDSRTVRARLQARIFGLTWLSYASYYATRKNLSVVKSRLDDELQVGVTWLGAIDTAYLVAYAAGQFGNGALGDRVGPRRMIGFGMIASAVACAAFGLASSAVVFLVAFGLNGLFQSTGWPNNVKTMGSWFGRRLRGRVMGLWSTNYQIGGIAATAAAAALLVHGGWRAAFLVPALWTAFVGLLVLLFLVERPADRGLLPTDDGSADASHHERSPFATMIRLPAVWILGGAYFGLKLIRYSLLFWLPFFLTRQLGYAEDTAGYVSTAFEAGGVVGAIVVGWIADRAFASNPLRLVVLLVASLGGALALLSTMAALGVVGVATGLAAVGFLLFGPDTLICGAAAQNLGGGRATASAAGIINGFGSIGAACQGMVTAGITQTWGWDALFVAFVAITVLSALILVPLAVRQTF